jgi:hypothetical protein
LRFLDTPTECFLYASLPSEQSWEGTVRDVYEVIRDKEVEITRVRHEIEALRSILPLLTDEADDDVAVDAPAYAPLRVVNRE